MIKFVVNVLTLVTFILLVGMLITITSCGKNNGSGKDKKTHYISYSHYSYNQRCQIIDVQGCGYTLNCFRNGVYYCVPTNNVRF